MAITEEGDALTKVDDDGFEEYVRPTLLLT